MLGLLLADLFTLAAEEQAAQPAIVAGHLDLAFADLALQVDDWGRRLRQSNVTSTDLVAIECANPSDFVPAYLAVLRSGGVVLPWSQSSPTGPDASDLQRAQISATVQGARFRRHRPSCPWMPKDTERVPAVVVFTSGTTGRPHGVLHTHESLGWGIWNSCSVADELLGDLRVPSDDNALRHSLVERVVPAGSSGLSFYTGMPLYSIAGLTVLHRSLLLGQVFAGGENQFDVNRLGGLLTGRKLNALALAPFMGERLLRWVDAQGPGGPPSAVLGIGLGGGSASARLAQQLEDALSCVVSIGYGTTEHGGPIAMSRPTDPASSRHTSVGRPVASVAVRIDPDIPGEQDRGLLSCMSPASMMGVLTREGLDHANDWVSTGDRVQLLADGSIVVLGRADGVILRGAHRIDPTAIEAALQAHTAVGGAGVVGQASRVPGESDVVAYLVLSESVTSNELVRHMASLLPSSHLPRRYLVTDTLPLTADGAVQRHALEEWPALPLG